jgi:hypothetical protein
VERVAAPEPLHGQPATVDKPMPAERLARVFRAARLEATGGRQKRPQEQLISAYQPRGDLCPYAHVAALPPVTARARAMSARSSSSGAFKAHARAMNIASTLRARPDPRARYASRSRRLARFRLTEPRICLLTAKPARPGPRVGTQRSTKARRSSRRPAWNTDWISLACLRRAVRGSPNGLTARLTAPPLDGEPLASLRAPPLQYLSSTWRTHALPETVRLRPAARVRLVRPLHGGTPSVDRRTCVVY